MIDDPPPMEQKEKRDDLSRCLSGSVGGFDGSVAGSILAKWYFFPLGNPPTMEKSVYSVSIVSFYYIVHLRHFISCSNFNP